MFIIEDSLHSETIVESESYEKIIQEIKRISIIPFETEPNVPPCQNHENCKREYDIIEYNTSTDPWVEIKRIPIFSISKNEIKWYNQKL